MKPSIHRIGRRSSLLLVLSALHSTIACSTGPALPDVVVLALDPAETVVGTAARIRIEGSGFHVVLRGELEENAWQEGALTVTVGGTRLEDIVLLSEETIEGTVPDTTPAGLHDLVVTFEDGRSGQLAGGFSVFRICSDDLECDDGDPCTSGDLCIDSRCGFGVVDDDKDGDGFVDVACGGDDCSDSLQGCGADCFPGNPAGESCDGADQDCDGIVDEAVSCGGLIADDPFGDGSPFAYVTAFEGKVYVGPSQDGSSVVRTEPDGSGGQSVLLQFFQDTTGNVAGNAAGGPYTSIGATGCTPGTLQCGPDNEDGRGIFTTATMAGSEWLVMGGSRAGGDLDYVYMSAGAASPQSFRYVDMSFTMGPQTRGFSAAHTFNDRLYMAFPDTGGKRPYLVALLTPPTVAPGLDTTVAEVLNLQADKIPGLATAGTAMIDAITDFNDRLYLANSGAWIRSANNTPSSAEVAAGDWVAHQPSAAAYGAKTSVVSAKTSDLEPLDKAVPQMAVFGGRLYAARNTTTGPQLWSCDPGASGGATECDSGDWSLVAGNSVGDLLLSQFDNPNNTSIGALVATDNELYVAFDNASSGVVVFRSTASTPLARSDFEGEAGCSADTHPALCDGLLGPGLGDATNTQVFFGTALTFGLSSTFYLAVGSSILGVRIYRFI